MKKSLLVLLLTVILASCGESPEKYNSRAFAVADSIAEKAESAFYIASDRHGVWRTAIFDNRYQGSYCSDWQSALSQYENENLTIAFKDKMKQDKLFVDSLFKTIKEHPDKSEPVYNKVKELYSSYLSANQLAAGADGSLQDYTNSINEAQQKFKTVKNDIATEK